VRKIFTKIKYFPKRSYAHACRFCASAYFTRIYLGGNCFYLRNDDLCYDLSEMDTNEEQCTGSYYSDDNLKELDGYVYAGKCRDVNGM
jgi:hypothetical protein